MNGNNLWLYGCDAITLPFIERLIYNVTRLTIGQFLNYPCNTLLP